MRRVGRVNAHSEHSLLILILILIEHLRAFISHFFMVDIAALNRVKSFQEV